MVAHASLTGANLHEPKGVAAASADQVYVADGLGSGVWTARSSGITNYNRVILTHKLIDISTAHSEWIVVPFAGDIIQIYTVLSGAITGVDAGISFEIGGTPVTSGGITVAFTSSAAGDVDQSTPSAANTLTAGQPIEIITDGASTGTADLTVTIVMDVT